MLQFVGLATLMHLAVIPLLGELVADAPPREQNAPIRLVSFPPEMLQQLQQRRRKELERAEKNAQKKKTPEPETKKPPEEEPPPEDLKGQIVDLPPSPDDRPPEEYDYLSEHNTRTERETVSRHRTKDYRNAMNEVSHATPNEPKPAAAERRSAAVEVGPNDPRDERDRKVAGQEKAFELPSVKKRDELALSLDPDLGIVRNQNQSEALRGNSDRLKLSLGDEPEDPKAAGTAPEQGQPAVELVPKIGVLAQLSGAPANDHIEGVDEGEGTFLNSREFKYASFFNRMKKGVSEHWRPLQEYRRRDPTGNIYGQRSRVTVLRIVLTAEGGLKDIEVTRSSGVDFLDAEAVAAFRRAEPFHNPPQGLVDQASGAIEFPFGFHIEFTRGGLGMPF